MAKDKTPLDTLHDCIDTWIDGRHVKGIADLPLASIWACMYVYFDLLSTGAATFYEQDVYRVLCKCKFDTIDKIDTGWVVRV